MTNTAILPTHFQIGSDVVRGEGTAVMLRNFAKAKGLDLPIHSVPPSAETVAFAEKVAGITFRSVGEHASSFVVHEEPESVGEIEIDPALIDGTVVQIPLDTDPDVSHLVESLDEVYAVAEDESNHPLLVQRDDEEARLHQIYDELNALDIVSLRKRASKAGLKGAYKGHAKTELVAFLFNQAKSA